MEKDLILIPVPLSELRTMIESAVQKVYNSNAADSQVLNSTEVKKLLKISYPTLQKWRDEKKIPFMQVNKKILYNKSDVLSILHGGK